MGIAVHLQGFAARAPNMIQSFLYEPPPASRCCGGQHTGVSTVARSYRPKRWRPELADPAGCYLLSQQLSLSPVTAQVLYNRGLTTPELAQQFLTAGREQILDPYLLKDMDRAVPLIQARMRQGGPIMVYGDYDADGVTGTAILVTALRRLGATVEYYIPNRFSEGYGLNDEALREIRQRGFDFVLSVDTGVTAVHEAEVARELGMTLVVSDHHEPGPVLPDVPALINPKRPDCTYPFKGLSGVGVAFKLAMALNTPAVWDLLDIVTLGTIADMVPLVGENRAIVREGLARLGSTQRPGLRALMEVAGVKQPVTATHIGYAIGPRINALGRMGSAMQGVELLLTDDPQQGAELARHLDGENKARQEVEAAILQEALAQAESLPPAEREYVLVLAGEGWHHGVVGICASRVLEAYHRPAILLSIDGEEARGSARSIPAFHMHRALSQVADLFTKFGGHAAAAGMTLRSKELVPELRRRLNALAKQWLSPEDLIPEQRVDAVVSLDQVNDQLLRELSALEPFGIGNPAPVLVTAGLQVVDGRSMGKEQQHLKLVLRPLGGGQLVPTVEAVGWNMATARPAVGDEVAVAYQPEINTYMGRSRLQLTMKDLRQGAFDGFGVTGLPALTESHCLAWDPLAGAAEPTQHGVLIDGRDDRLARLLAQTSQSLPEVAVARDGGPAEPEEAVLPVDQADMSSDQAVLSGDQAALPADEAAEGDEPGEARLTYLAALSRPAGVRVLVLTSSPWAAEWLAISLGRRLAELRGQLRLWLPGEPEPTDGSLVVAAFGQAAQGAYSDTVLYHPPFRQTGYPGERLHLLWKESEWLLTESALGWPYPDRDVLVHLYKILRAGDAAPERLAAALGEVPGPWNRLRFESGVAVFTEIGITDANGGLLPSARGAKFQLETSLRYRSGLSARRLLAQRGSVPQ